MFRIVAEPTFTVPVFLSRPAAEVPVKVTFTFRHKGRRELKAWRDRAAGFEHDAAFLAEVIEGWGSEIVGADDKPLPYSVEALAQLFDAFPGASTEVLRQYQARLQDARAGN